MSSVHVDISRLDVIKLSMLVSLRHRSSLISLAVLTLLIATMIAATRGMPEAPIEWFGLLIVSVLGLLAGIVLVTLMSLISVLLMSSETSGVLGRHTYTIRDDG